MLVLDGGLKKNMSRVAPQSFLHAVEHEHSVPAARRHFNMVRARLPVPAVASLGA